MAVINVKSAPYNAPGASGSSAANRVAIAAAAAALQANDTLYFPPDLYTCDAATIWSILISGKSNIELTCDAPGSAIVAMDAATAADPDPSGNTVNLFRVENTHGLTIRNLRFEGRKANSDTATVYDAATEHHRGFFFDTCSDITIRNVVGNNFTGDFVQFYNACSDILVEDCTFNWNQRSGISMAPTSATVPIENVVIRRCTFIGTSNQAVDNEHGRADHVEVYDNYIEWQIGSAGINTGQSIAVAGFDLDSPRVPSKFWTIRNNTIVGTVVLAYATDIVIENNTITVPSGFGPPAVEMSYECARNRVVGNTIAYSGNAQHAVYIQGTAGQGPESIDISGNTITCTAAARFGIRADGVISVAVSGNTLRGAGSAAAGFHAVRVRTTVVERPVQSVIVAGNDIRDFGQHGVSLLGTAGATITSAKIYANKFSNSSPSGPMTIGISLDDGTGALQEGLVLENTFGTGVTTGVANTPGGATMSYAFPFEQPPSRPVSFTGGSFVGGIL